MSALDAGTGKELWQTGYAAPFTMHSAAVLHGPGPKSTPTLADGKLYAIGMTGVGHRLRRRHWQTALAEARIRGGAGVYEPRLLALADRGLVIFHVGGHDEGALTAFDANTGDVKWRWAGDGPGYGSPIVADLGGTRQIVTITQGKLVGVDAATGAALGASVRQRQQHQRGDADRHRRSRG